MFKSLVVILGIVGVLAAVYGYAASLPRMQSLTVERMLNAPADVIWSAVTDWENQPTWRDDLDKVEIQDDNTFVEYPKKGPPITFTIVTAREPAELKLELSGSFSAVYELKLENDNGNTRVTESYEIDYPSPIGRLMAKLFFDLEAFANTYLDNLEKHLKSP